MCIRDSFYILDKAGKEISHARLNMSASAKPGNYVAKLNNSSHPVQIRENTLTKCSAGSVVLRGNTDEYYYVLDSTQHEMAHNKLGTGLAFFPGKYMLQMNNTPQEFEVKPSAVTDVQAGILTAVSYTHLDVYKRQAQSREMGRLRGGRGGDAGENQHHAGAVVAGGGQ